ncbi:hypothetical protein SI65_01563 [Aspergillus cristatus]|uniref:Uncharacterized protein n=1 Tax=Aspergillus cristatus TaxID=573508 RepID=A0A1E3BSL7_ASPCR|nr:hypothetical protein SI65_01563 [Aspergillus cristatus]
MTLPRSGSFQPVTSPTTIIQYSWLRKKITRGSEKQLYGDGTGKKQLGAHFKSFSDSLSQVMTKGEDDDSEDEGDNDNNDDADAADEDKPELVSKVCLSEMVRAISQGSDMHKLAPQPTFISWVNEHQMKIKIGTSGKPTTVKNDGSIYIVKEMGPRRRERAKLPITNYEAKRRDAGGVKRKAGQKEKFTSSSSHGQLQR